MIESAPVFIDGFGRRVVRVTRDEAPVELLQIDPELAQNPAVVAALRERIGKVASLRLSSYARVQRLDEDPAGGATIVSEYVKGWRLSDVLDVAESENITFDIGVVMLLLRQLLPTAAMLSNHSKETASGALGPEHLLLTPQGRLVLTDYVVGPAIDALRWPPERLWRSLRVATPPAGTTGRSVSPRADVVQVGVTMLSLIIGRRLRDDEFPERLEVLVGSSRQRTPDVIDAPLSDGLRTWLNRTLQLHTRSFKSVFEARMAMEQLLATDTSLIAQPAELDGMVARFDRLMPAFELPALPDEHAADSLLDMPAPTHDWVPLAAAFDEPPAPDVAAPVAVPAFDASTEPDPLVAAIAAFRLPDAAAEPAVAVIEAPVAVAPPPPAAPSAPEPSPAIAPPVVPLAALADSVRNTEPAPVEPESAPRQAAARTTRAMPATPEPDLDVPDDACPTVEAATPWWRSTRVVAALVALAVAQAVLLGWQMTRPSEQLGTDGELVVQSRPEGARVSIDDEDRGVTPLTVRVSPGTHVLQVRVGSGEPRVIPLSIRAGVQTAQYVEMQGVSATGILEVRSEPSRARVTVDGQARGQTPVTLRDVAPGDHEVVIERAGWKSTQTVRIEPGGTAQLVVPIR